jgi:hypothetical protein
LPLPVPKRSPYRAPFQNNPESALFWQSDKIKRSRIAILRAVFGPDGFLVDPENRSVFLKKISPEQFFLRNPGLRT